MEPIRIEGLAQFSKNLRKIDGELPKALRVAMNGAAQIVVDEAVPGIPRRSGRAARSVKARSTRTAVRVAGGGARVPYYPWLDFGGKVGPDKSVSRPFIREGRYLWAGYGRKRDAVAAAVERALLATVAAAGVDVD
ncbi:HK97 gp10 family phage protein [Micromonospora echinospora]